MKNKYKSLLKQLEISCRAIMFFICHEINPLFLLWTAEKKCVKKFDKATALNYCQRHIIHDSSSEERSDTIYQ